MENDYDDQLFRWAHKYDGYSRLACDPGKLRELIKPLQEAYNHDGSVPDWAGVDLLRGWAFYLARDWRSSGDDQFSIEKPAILMIVDSVNRHQHARASDRAPVR